MVRNTRVKPNPKEHEHNVNGKQTVETGPDGTVYDVYHCTCGVQMVKDPR